jgi:hypothetical protein
MMPRPKTLGAPPTVFDRPLPPCIVRFLGEYIGRRVGTGSS